MAYATTTHEKGTGRASAEISANLREQIRGGEYGAGQFLAPVRELSQRYGVASKTAHRALKALAREGLVVAVPGRGFRVLPGAQDPLRGCPVVYVLADTDPGEKNAKQQPLLVAFQAAAAERGWSVLTTGCMGRSNAQVLEELKRLRASGVITDSLDDEFTVALREAGIPTVLVDMAERNRGLDAVMQDGHNGGRQAAQHLLERGHKRIAWFGPVNDNPHVQDRLGGVLGALCTVWGRMPADLLVNSSDPKDITAARRLLSRRDPPDAIMAMWREQALLLKRAADELGLAVGRDFEMVGWTVEEAYESTYRPAFAPGAVPPAVVWSARTMAETAVARLAERRGNPELEPLIVKVPTRLKFAEET